MNYTGKELTHFAKFILGLNEPRTQTTPREQNAIIKYCKNCMIAVEIGVFEGYNTLNIVKSMDEKGILYAIDPFYKGKLGFCYGELISSRYVAGSGYSAKVNFIKKLSSEAVRDVPDNIDFIFIDGDHSYNGIKTDWELWSGKLKKGGIIALHDTNFYGMNPSVKSLGSFTYYNDLIRHNKNFELLETVDSMNILTCKND